MTPFDPIFPGMDPFIEGQRWREFHNQMIARIQNELARLLVPRYDVAAEQVIYLSLVPDVALREGRSDTEPLAYSTLAVSDAAYTFAPVIFDEEEPLHIEIRDDAGRLVTLVEVLSPANKTSEFAAYQRKRRRIASSCVHLIEIDLLRGGRRVEDHTTDMHYVSHVLRVDADCGYEGAAYPSGLRDPLPVLPVPLANGDSDVPLDLPGIVANVYESARYRLLLDYQRDLDPPLDDDDAEWVNALLRDNAVLNT